MLPFKTKGTWRVWLIQDPEFGRWPWLIPVGTTESQVSCEREVEGSDIIMTEAEISKRCEAGTLLALKTEKGAGAKEHRRPPEAGMGNAAGSPPQPPEGTQSHPPILDFWSSELQTDTFGLFEDSNFLIIWYSSNRKLIRVCIIQMPSTLRHPPMWLLYQKQVYWIHTIFPFL